MARRKKQKIKKSEKTAEAVINQPALSTQDEKEREYAQAVEEEGSKNGASLKKDSFVKGAKTLSGNVPKSGMRLGTAIGGMILTFILGLYLGSLLPQIMQGKATAESSPASSGASVPKPKPAEMADALAHIIEGLEVKLKAEPDNVHYLIEMGNAWFDAGRPPKAIEAYEKALLHNPDNADVLTDLGIMYRETGNFQKALDCFQKAVTVQPGHQNAMYNEGVVLVMDLDKKDEGAEAWKRLLELNPQARAPDGTPLSEVIKNLK